MSKTRKEPTKSASRGFTLMEFMFAITLCSLLVLAMMSLYIMMTKTAAKAVSIGTTSLDAANAIQKVTFSLRQAQSFQVMDNATYDAVDGSGNVVAVTGLTVTFPAAASALSVVATASGATVPLTGASAIFDRTAGGSTLLFYRSDSKGNPAPSTGSCLWMTGTDMGVTVNRALIKTVSPTATAVQFMQPYMPDGTTPIPNAVEISIVTANNNGSAGTVSSHSTRGGTTTLTGEQTYLRDHNPTGVTSTGIHGRTLNAN